MKKINKEFLEAIEVRKNYLIETLELNSNELKWDNNTLILYKFNGKIALMNIRCDAQGDITILEKNIDSLKEEINYHKKLFKGIATRKEFQEIKNYYKTLNIKKKNNNKYIVETLNLECYIVTIEE